MADFLTELEKAIANRLNQLSPEEKKIQSKSNVNRMAQQLSPAERGIAERAKQLSPEERKIQSKVNLDRMGKQQIDIRNAKAQAYLDKKAAEKLPSMASRAGRATAQAEQAVAQGAKKAGSMASEAAKKALPKLAAGARAAGRVAPVVGAATELVRAGKLATDAEYRKENEAAYEDLANKNFLQRAVEGGLGGVASIYAAGKNIDDTIGAYTRAMKGDMAFKEKQKELIARGILDEEGKPIRRQEPAPTATAPEFDGEALSRALIEAPPVQPAETAPRTADVEAAYKEIEAGTVPKAIPVDESKMEAVELPEDRMNALFRKTTGTSFNPKSKMDASKMQQLRAFVSSNPDVLNKSDTKIALDFYRTL